MDSTKTSFLQNEWLIIIISFIWGFGLAMLFRRVCTNDDCIVIKAPPEFALNNNNIINKDKCYHLQRYNTNCEY
jgi:hypothetical protein